MTLSYDSHTKDGALNGLEEEMSSMKEKQAQLEKSLQERDASLNQLSKTVLNIKTKKKGLKKEVQRMFVCLRCP